MRERFASDGCEHSNPERDSEATRVSWGPGLGVDAWDLAVRLRTGRLERPIFKAPRQFGMLRELARTHMAIAHDLVRVQARLKSAYRSRGIRTPGRAVQGHAQRDSWQRQLPATSRKTSEGAHVISIGAPPRTDPSGQFIYWKQQM